MAALVGNENAAAYREPTDSTEHIEVGESSNIQDGAVLHSAPGFPLMMSAHVTVGHRAILHGCHIGAGALISMGAGDADRLSPGLAVLWPPWHYGRGNKTHEPWI